MSMHSEDFEEPSGDLFDLWQMGAKSASGGEQLPRDARPVGTLLVVDGFSPWGPIRNLCLTVQAKGPPVCERLRRWALRNPRAASLDLALTRSKLTFSLERVQVVPLRRVDGMQDFFELRIAAAYVLPFDGAKEWPQTIERRALRRAEEERERFEHTLYAYGHSGQSSRKGRRR